MSDAPSPTPEELIRPYEDHAQEWAARLRSGGNWVHDHLEKPEILKMAHLSKGEKVVCLGCGSGEEIPAIQACGADVILGIDLSPAMLKLAQEQNPDVRFLEGDIASPSLDGIRCDVVFCSLAMHYAEDWRPSLRAVHAALRDGGQFVFSTHHPLIWSAETARDPVGTVRRHGYSRNAEGAVEIWGDYGRERWISDIWFGNMHVNFHHKTFSTMVRTILESGFEIADVQEPLAEPDGSPEGGIYSRIPPFLFFSLRKPDRLDRPRKP